MASPREAVAHRRVGRPLPDLGDEGLPKRSPTHFGAGEEVFPGQARSKDLLELTGIEPVTS